MLDPDDRHQRPPPPRSTSATSSLQREVVGRRRERKKRTSGEGEPEGQGERSVEAGGGEGWRHVVVKRDGADATTANQGEGRLRLRLAQLGGRLAGAQDGRVRVSSVFLVPATAILRSLPV
nr:unnamed protein product [Digitaria exilis]